MQCRDDLAREKQKWHRENGIIRRESITNIQQDLRQFRERHNVSVLEKTKHKVLQHRLSLEDLKRTHEKELDTAKTRIRNRMKAKRREERRAKQLREKMRHVESEISATKSMGDKMITSSSSTRCELCSSQFSSWFRKKYTCEVCGFDVCSKCSHLDEENSHRRTCVVCVNAINDPLVLSVGRSGSHPEFEDSVLENQV